MDPRARTPRRLLAVAVAVVGAVALGLAVPGPGVGATGGAGGRAGLLLGAGIAVEVPMAQSDPPMAGVRALACWGPGECVAGGFSTPPGGLREALLVRMTGGVWQAAVPVPFAAPPTEVPETVEWMECPAAGECVAGGGSPAFVVRMTGGVWGPATLVEIPGFPPTRATFWAGACPAVGECTAGGWFEDPAGGFAAFTVTMAGGVLAPAVPIAYAVPIESAPDADATIDALVCWAPGECVTGGSVKVPGGGVRPWLARMTGGAWAPAAPVTFAVPDDPTSTAANKVAALACWAPGECVVGGRFAPAGGGTQGFLARVTGGVGQPGYPVILTGAAADPPSGKVEWLACPGEGACVGGGRFGPAGGGTTTYQLAMEGGAWLPAVRNEFPEAVAAPPEANQPRGACSDVGRCIGVGAFRDAGGGTQGYVVAMVDGVWGAPVPHTYVFPVPTGAAAGADGLAAACGWKGPCLAGGSVGGVSENRRAYVVPATWVETPDPGPRFVG